MAINSFRLRVADVQLAAAAISSRLAVDYLH